MEYKIIGTYQGNTEEIDAFDTREEAVKMLAEYKLAFGSSWSLSIKRGRKDA